MTGNKYQKGLSSTTFFNIKKSGAGFTFVESMIVIAMIGILSIIVIPSYQSAKNQLALERSAVKLAQDLRKVQEMAMSAQECEPCGGIVPEGGYGIYIRKTPSVPAQTTYRLFADMDDNQRYNHVQDVIIEEVSLESKIIIYDLSRNIVTIAFKAPDPKVFFSGKSNDPDSWNPFSNPEITIAIEDNPENPANQKVIKVNAVGLIYID